MWPEILAVSKISARTSTASLKRRREDPLSHTMGRTKIGTHFPIKVNGAIATHNNLHDPANHPIQVHFGKMFFKKCDTKLTLTIAYHPQTHGQSEGVNQCLEIFLRCSVSTTPAKWSSWLSMDEFWYNSLNPLQRRACQRKVESKWS
jgi:hypothetical protein